LSRKHWQWGVLTFLGTLACRQGTAALTPDLDSRFQAEGILHRADDQVFRYTYYSRSTNGNRWEDRDASIIVTRTTVYIHKNEKVGLEITARTRKDCDVHREADRVIIGAGSGKSHVSWSFRTPDDAEGWTTAIRAVIDQGD
jgi:hypothetical protein